MPVEVNGVKLNFLLDTGIEETILFSLEDTEEIVFANAEKIKFKGLGNSNSIVGLKTTHNKVFFGDFHDEDHTIFVVLDQIFNLSSHVGIPVNGIVGYRFFKDNPIEINYDRKRITIYRTIDKMQRKLRKFHKLPISIEKSKPYVSGSFLLGDMDLPAKLLLDTGNSDAVWLFEDKSDLIKVPNINYRDYLGFGLNGEVYGKRARITKFSFYDFAFDHPIAAFPETESLKNIIMVNNRIGSVGSEVLKRFRVVLDYPNGNIYLKKGHRFKEGFSYNVSGLSVQHSGLQWVEEKVETTLKVNLVYDSEDRTRNNRFVYKFELLPVYKISNVREGSPAANAGLQKGDILLKINNKSAYHLDLEEINILLKSEDGEKLKIEVERGSEVIKTSFRLIGIL